MKKFALALCAVYFITLSGCIDKGEVTSSLNGTESNLPEHLKGLRVDRVGIGSGNEIYVATFPGHDVISTQYQTKESNKRVVVILPAKDTTRNIKIKEILFENNSIILAKKQ